MKVHPAPKKRNTTLQYDVASTTPLSCRQKKLRRLPHIFAKVLELPFSSDADVIIDETPEFLRFIIPTDDTEFFEDNIRASTIEIYPGVTKIVIINGGGEGGGGLGEGEFELDVWRFRLPGETVPDLATAEYRDGELVVMVPKGGADDDVEDVLGTGQLLLDQTQDGHIKSSENILLREAMPSSTTSTSSTRSQYL